jgi:hypothetical protein
MIPSSSMAPTARVYAELPSGQVLVLGTDNTTCPGPDVYGACRIGQTDRPCKGATWCYGGPNGWQFAFSDHGSSMCPAALLDPLGVPATPLD